MPDTTDIRHEFHTERRVYESPGAAHDTIFALCDALDATTLRAERAKRRLTDVTTQRDGLIMAADIFNAENRQTEARVERYDAALRELLPFPDPHVQKIARDALAALEEK